MHTRLWSASANRIKVYEQSHSTPRAVRRRHLVPVRPRAESRLGPPRRRVAAWVKLGQCHQKCKKKLRRGRHGGARMCACGLLLLHINFFIMLDDCRSTAQPLIAGNTTQRQSTHRALTRRRGAGAHEKAKAVSERTWAVSGSNHKKQHATCNTHNLFQSRRCHDLIVTCIATYMYKVYLRCPGTNQRISTTLMPHARTHVIGTIHGFSKDTLHEKHCPLACTSSKDALRVLIAF